MHMTKHPSPGSGFPFTLGNINGSFGEDYVWVDSLGVDRLSFHPYSSWRGSGRGLDGYGPAYEGGPEEPSICT